MRKFLATMAVCITLIGTFAPVAFSVSVARDSNISAKAISISTNTLIANAQATGSTTPPPQGDSDTADPKNTECSWYDGFCHSFRIILMVTMFIPNAIVAGIATLTDASIHYSISSASFQDISSKDSMVYVGWSIARDIANLGFIFALFVIAFSLILNRSILNFDPKKAIVKVIVMALLINFSMLFCKLIIQTGDLFANVLYTRIDSPDTTTITETGIVNEIENGPSAIAHKLGVRGVTLGIVNNINPQKLMQSTGADYNIETVEKFTFGLVKIKGWAYYVQMGALAFYCMIVNYSLLYLFTSIAMLFGSRIFGLWILIIISPLAFVSYAIPSLEDNPYFGFKNWLDELVKLTFTAPIFLFFCYLVVSLLSHQNFEGSIGNPNWGSFNVTLGQILAKLGATIYILFKGKKIAFETAGRASKLAQKIIDKTTGALLNVGLAAATGGTAMVGRQVVGRLGTKLAESAAVKGMMQSNSTVGKFLGRQVSAAGKKVGAASFDIRDSKRFKGAMDGVNKSFGEKIDMGDKFKRAGGFEKEGGIRDIVNQARGKFEDYKIKQDKDILDRLGSGNGSEEKRDLRAQEAELEREKQKAKATEAQIEAEAQEVDPTAFIAKKMDDAEKARQDKTQLNIAKSTAETAKNTAIDTKTNATNLKMTLEKNSEDLERRETDLKTQKQQLVQKRNDITADDEEAMKLKASIDSDIKAKQSEIDDVKEEKEKLGKKIKANDEDIQKAEGTIKANELIVKTKDKEIAKKDEEIQKATTYATMLADIPNVRQAQQERRDLEARESISPKKSNMTSAEEKMTKEEEKTKKLESDIEALAKKKTSLTGDRLKQAELEIEQKNTELEAQKQIYEDKKELHKAAKDIYDEEFGSKLMALRDFEAEAVKIYKNRDDIKQMLAEGNESILDAQLQVNQTQDSIENVEYERRSDFISNVESTASIFGEVGDHANMRSVDQARRDYLNKK